MKSIIKGKFSLFFASLFLMFMYACDHSKHDNHNEHEKQEHGDHDHNEADTTMVKAVCNLIPTAGNSVTGTVNFTSTSDGVNVEIDIKGLTPGKHGFHIHEFGDCSAVDGTSAGGHFNPSGHDHGSQTGEMRHAGDLGNLEADANGNAKVSFLDKVIKLSGSSSIIGRSIILHEKEDDLKTQPTGNAGARVACGSIVIGK